MISQFSILAIAPWTSLLDIVVYTFPYENSLGAYNFRCRKLHFHNGIYQSVLRKVRRVLIPAWSVLNDNIYIYIYIYERKKKAAWQITLTYFGIMLITPSKFSTCPRGVMVKAMDCSYSSRAITFTFGQIPLGKVWIELFSLQLWINSRTD